MRLYKGIRSMSFLREDPLNRLCTQREREGGGLREKIHLGTLYKVTPSRTL